MSSPVLYFFSVLNSLTQRHISFELRPGNDQSSLLSTLSDDHLVAVSSPGRRVDLLTKSVRLDLWLLAFLLLLGRPSNGSPLPLCLVFLDDPRHRLGSRAPFHPSNKLDVPLAWLGSSFSRIRLEYSQEAQQGHVRVVVGRWLTELDSPIVSAVLVASS